MGKCLDLIESPIARFASTSPFLGDSGWTYDQSTQGLLRVPEYVSRNAIACERLVRQSLRMSETLEQNVAKWINWLDVLRRVLMEIYVDKLVFDELYETVRLSGTTSGFWVNHYQRLYVSKQTMAVRRITRGKAGTVSFTRLFVEIITWRSELNEAWFRELVSERSNLGSADLDRLAEEFSQSWCGGGTSISEAVINADRQGLGQRVNNVRAWADVMVAHLVDGDDLKKMTWGELNSSFEKITETLNRYESLLTGSVYIFPPALPLNWYEPFNRVLIPSADSGSPT